MTLDLDPVADFDGIKKFNVLDYLMKKVDFYKLARAYRIRHLYLFVFYPSIP